MLTKSTFAEHPRQTLSPPQFPSLFFPPRIMDSDFWEPKSAPWIESPEWETLSLVPTKLLPCNVFSNSVHPDGGRGDRNSLRDDSVR